MAYLFPIKRAVVRSIRPEHYPDIKKRYEAGESTVSIGKSYGDKDHTTILYHLRKMGAWKRRDNTIKRERGVNPDKIKDLPCSVEGCEKRARTRGMCQTHYMNWWLRNGRAVEAVVRCEHKDSRCECVNRGKLNYAAYLEESGSRPVDTGDI